MRLKKGLFSGFGAERFVASLLASLSLGHITADKRFAFGSPKPTSWASFIRQTLSAIGHKGVDKNE